MARPNVGDRIYVEGTIYLSHGADDFAGGLCTVKAVKSHFEKGHEVSSVEIEEDLAADGLHFLAGDVDGDLPAVGDDAQL